MPANKSNHSTPSKEKPINGRKRRSSSLKHRKLSRNHLLHSEYRSTYTWHEYTGGQEHTVVRRAPQPPPTIDTSTKLQSAKSIEDDNSEGTSLEPPLPRRKKNPELAYRTHEFIIATDGGGRGIGGGGVDAFDSSLVADKVREATKVLPASQLSKAISRISTEYRLQFAWPRRQQPQLTNGDVLGGKDESTAEQQHQQQAPRKSLSMGALRQGSMIAGGVAPAPVHKKRQPACMDHRRTGRDGAQASELEPLVTTDGALPEADEHDEVDGPQQQQSQIEQSLKKSVVIGRAVRIMTEPPAQENNNKYKKTTRDKPMTAAEVIELRRELKRLADEYKHRDWGGDMAGEEDEATLWKRVSTNHALNALSLARSATKEEKEKENSRKIGPTTTTMTTTTAMMQQQVPPAGRPSSVQARPVHQTTTTTTTATTILDDFKPDQDNDRALARARKDFLIRHHLDRTTGAGDGALLPSPTREKLEPVMPRRRDESADAAQPRSKSSPKNSPRSARSQSVGPSVMERRSPKRRPPSVAKDGREKSSERHPRPSSMSSRWKTREQARSGKTKSTESTVNRTLRITSRPAKTITIKPFLATNAPPQRQLVHPSKTGSRLETPIGAGNAVECPLLLKSNANTNRAASITTAAAASSTTTITATTTTTNTTTTTTTTTMTTSASSAATSCKPASGQARSYQHPTSNQSNSRQKQQQQQQQQQQQPAPIRPGSLGLGHCSKQHQHDLSSKARAVPSATTADHHHLRNSNKPSATNPKPIRQTGQTGQAMTAEPQVNGQQSAAAAAGEAEIASPGSVQPQLLPGHRAGWIDDEPVVKSPPEPTRVKSPEQMIMRSPEPVNWTVPLDTGKTFTVTQNVREGEPPTRAHSEARSWIGPGAAIICQSAPSELDARQKLTEHKQQQGHKSPDSESISLGSFSGTNGHKEQGDSPASPLAKPVKNEQDESDSKAKQQQQQSVTGQQPQQDLLEMARDRFDKFWGTGKPADGTP